MRKFPIALCLLALSPSLAGADELLLEGFAVSTISELSEPTAIAVTEEGTLVIYEAGAERLVFMPPDGQAPTGINVTGRVLSMATAPTGGVFDEGLHVASASGEAGVVSIGVLPADASAVETRFSSAADNEAEPLALAFDTDGSYGDELFVVDSVDPDSVVRLSPEMRRTGAWPTRLGLTAVATAWPGGFENDLYELYTAAGDLPSAVVHRLATGASEALLESSALGEPVAMIFTPPTSCFGDQAYILERRNGVLLRLDRELNLETVMRDVPVGADSRLAAAPDGSALYLSVPTRGEVIALEPEGRDLDGDGAADWCDDDDDGDGVNDDEDNCAELPNPGQNDLEQDGTGDACDVCPDHFDPEQPDDDGDGVGDACDLCPDDFDPEQLDADSDFIGDACDDLFNPPADWDAPEIPHGHDIGPGGDEVAEDEGVTVISAQGCGDCSVSGGAGSTWWWLGALGVAMLVARRRWRV